MDDPNEGVLVLTFNKSELKLHRYCFNLTPSEQMIILQRIMPVVTQESFAFEREMGKQEAAAPAEGKPVKG
jgi:hypothetical protein